jgi:uncharacterized YccA/Bax inhibitor family protein
MNRSSNPFMKATTFESVAGAGQMTLSGTLGKVSILMALLFAGATVGWLSHSIVLLFVGLIGGLVLGIWTSFKPSVAPYTAPAYAIVEGLLVGTVSLFYAQQMVGTKYAGAVPLAVLGTLVVFGVMLFLYATRIIKVGQTFVAVVAGATAAIAITYLFTMIGGIFFKGLYSMPIYQATPIGIGFSLFVIVLAALNLAMDFKIIEDGVNSRAPKYMEWYAGFGLLVTLVWLYLEILRLLSKLSRR